MSKGRGGSDAGARAARRGATGLVCAGTSLLERLMLHNALYKKSSDGYNPHFVTKLLWNYRWGWGESGAGMGSCPTLQLPFPGVPLSPAVPQPVREMGQTPHSARGEHRGHPLHAFPTSPRSHEAILRIPNELFYDSELKACEGDEFDIRNFYCAWEELPKKVRGRQSRGWEEPPSCSPADPQVSAPPGLPHHLPRGLRGRPERSQEPLFLQHG